MEVLQERTIDVESEKRQDWAEGQIEPQCSCNSGLPQGRLDLGWPFRIVQSRQGLLDIGQAVPWEEAHQREVVSFFRGTQLRAECMKSQH